MNKPKKNKLYYNFIKTKKKYIFKNNIKRQIKEA